MADGWDMDVDNWDLEVTPPTNVCAPVAAPAALASSAGKEALSIERGAPVEEAGTPRSRSSTASMDNLLSALDASPKPSVLISAGPGGSGLDNSSSDPSAVSMTEVVFRQDTADISLLRADQTVSEAPPSGTVAISVAESGLYTECQLPAQSNILSGEGKEMVPSDPRPRLVEAPMSENFTESPSFDIHAHLPSATASQETLAAPAKEIQSTHPLIAGGSSIAPQKVVLATETAATKVELAASTTSAAVIAMGKDAASRLAQGARAHATAVDGSNEAASVLVPVEVPESEGTHDAITESAASAISTSVFVKASESADLSPALGSASQVHVSTLKPLDVIKSALDTTNGREIHGSERRLRAALECFYREREPDKLGNVPEIARRYAGCGDLTVSGDRVVELWAQLGAKYGLRPHVVVQFLSAALPRQLTVQWSSPLAAPLEARRALSSPDAVVALRAALEAGDADAIGALCFRGCPVVITATCGGSSESDIVERGRLELKRRAWQALLGWLPPSDQNAAEGLQKRREAYREMRMQVLETINSRIGAMDEGLGSDSPSKAGACRLLCVTSDKVTSDMQASWPGETFMKQAGVVNAAMAIVLTIVRRRGSYARSLCDMAVLLLFAMGFDSTDTAAADAIEADAFWCLLHLAAELGDELFLSHSYGSSALGAGQSSERVGRTMRLLRKYDQQLALCLERLDLGVSLVLRLSTGLCTRAGFALADCALLWDSLLADPIRFEFLDCIIVALLLLSRAQLLVCTTAEAASKAFLGLSRSVSAKRLLRVAWAVCGLERRSVAAVAAGTSPSDTYPPTPIDNDMVAVAQAQLSVVWGLVRVAGTEAIEAGRAAAHQHIPTLREKAGLLAESATLAANQTLPLWRERAEQFAGSAASAAEAAFEAAKEGAVASAAAAESAAATAKATASEMVATTASSAKRVDQPHADLLHKKKVGEASPAPMDVILTPGPSASSSPQALAMVATTQSGVGLGVVPSAASVVEAAVPLAAIARASSPSLVSSATEAPLSSKVLSTGLDPRGQAPTAAVGKVGGTRSIPLRDGVGSGVSGGAGVASKTCVAGDGAGPSGKSSNPVDECGNFNDLINSILGPPEGEPKPKASIIGTGPPALVRAPPKAPTKVAVPALVVPASFNDEDDEDAPPPALMAWPGRESTAAPALVQAPNVLKKG